MYSQLLYLIIVLLVFSFQPLPKTGTVSYSNLTYMAVISLLFTAWCRSAFQRLRAQASRGVFLSALSMRYHRTQTRFFITAVALLVVYTYIFNLKMFLRVIPGFDSSTTISGLAGLAVYTAHLCIIWYYSHPVYQAIHNSQASRFEFIRANLSFAVVLLVPWLVISTLSDLLQFVRMPAFISPDLAQLMLTALALVGFVVFGPWLMIRLWRCEPLPEGRVREELEAYCREHGFRVGGFLLWPILGGEMLTAGVMGVLPRLRYILVTSGLINILELSELKAVVAHEMGHVRKKHLLFFVSLFLLFIMLAYSLSGMLDLLLILALSNRTVLHWALTPDLGPGLLAIASNVFLLLLMLIFLRFVFGFFLRNSERQADLFALELLGTPFPLISSFEKIASHSGKIMDLPNWHHYSIRERIEFLLAASKDSQIGRKHNRKLYGGAIVSVLVFIVVFFAGLMTDRSGLAKSWRSDIQLAIVEEEFVQRPLDAELQAAYGGLLFEAGRYSEAESVLNAALGFDPNNASILNNLAWLYATSPAPYRNPEEALELATRAADIKPEPHVLDTLAEAYYINGRYEEALSAINQAISQGGPQQSYFFKQREKYERALKGRV